MSPYLYNGKELDEETGLYYYGARFYDAQLGRFHTDDPLAKKYYSWSSYNYTMNNPIKFVDPDGTVVNPYLMYDGENNENNIGTMYVYEDNDTPDDYSDDYLVTSFEAKNDAVSSSKGKWEDGVYDMLDTDESHKHGDQTDSNGTPCSA